MAFSASLTISSHCRLTVGSSPPKGGLGSDPHVGGGDVFPMIEVLSEHDFVGEVLSGSYPAVAGLFVQVLDVRWYVRLAPFRGAYRGPGLGPFPFASVGVQLYSEIGGRGLGGGSLPLVVGAETIKDIDHGLRGPRGASPRRWPFSAGRCP